jgi:predicted enzyme related to lactoylglutathione lyase
MKRKAADGTAVEVGIVTKNGEELAEFYVRGLRFELQAVYRFPRGTVRRLKRGSARCKLFQPVEGVVPIERSDPWYASPGICYAALLVENAEEEVAAVESAGGSVLEGITSHREGARYALVADPEGNVWEVLEEERSGAIASK